MLLLHCVLFSHNSFEYFLNILFTATSATLLLGRLLPETLALRSLILIILLVIVASLTTVRSIALITLSPGKIWMVSPSLIVIIRVWVISWKTHSLHFFLSGSL